MRDDITPLKYGFDDIAVIYGYDVNTELMDGCIKEIDSEFYSGATTDPEAIKSWVFEHPQFCFVLEEKSTKKVVGYMYCFPMTEEATLGFLKGERTFKELTLDDMDPFVGEGLYNLYIASLAVKEKYHDMDVRRMLFECFLNQAISLAKEDMYINYIFMEIAGDYEYEICRCFDIQKITENKLKREIYGGLFDLKRFIRLDNYDAIDAVYDTKHAKKILMFKEDYGERLKQNAGAGNNEN